MRKFISFLAIATALCAPAALAQKNNDIDFGDNESIWANNGECDDPRFSGPAAASILLDQDAFHDAADCEAAFLAGDLYLAGEGELGVADIDGIVFGDDTSEWANDDECDDPRFSGPGSAAVLLDEDAYRDGSDCRSLYLSGDINFDGEGSTNSGNGDIDFGDDASMWSNDGECDDPRFEGPGAADIMLDEDAFHDASDCESLYNSGDVSFVGSYGGYSSSDIDFGDDSSEWSNDTECDDPRFDGPGMTTTPLFITDAYADASDCEAAYNAGDIWPRDSVIASTAFYGIDFGDDSGDWPNDGECDDPRFEGPAMASDPSDSDLYGDATDCMLAFSIGDVGYRGTEAGGAATSGQDGSYDYEDHSDISFDGIYFGDNSSEWAYDSECDDPRFEGPAMAASLEELHAYADATDCSEAYRTGDVIYRDHSPDLPGLFLVDGIDFGTDGGEYINDGECDDPRFEGVAMASFLIPEDRFNDASDCLELYNEGRVTFRDGLDVLQHN